MKRATLLAAIMTLHLTTATAQMDSYLACRRYTTQDGLPQMQTETVWQDSKGYIYVGTLSGFVRFDGRHFTPFLSGRRENIVGFAETDGQVRALGFRRQWLIDGDQVTMVPIDQTGRRLINNFNSGDLPRGYVILENEQEQQRQICRLTGKGFEPLTRGPLLDGMTPDRRLYLDTKTGLHVPTGSIFSYQRNASGLYAFGSDGIYTVSGRLLKMKTAYRFEAPDYGLIARATGDSSFVIADAHSLYHYDGQRVERIATGFNLIKGLMIDCWQRLWVATYQGLYCYFSRDFRNYRLTDGNDIVRAIGNDGHGHLMMGTLNGKILTADTPLTTTTMLCDDPQQYFAPSAATLDGKVYLAGNGDGLQLTVTADGQTQMAWLQLPEDRYQFVTATDDRIIFGSRRQLTAYNPKTGLTDTISTTVRHPWCAASDQQGRLWVGSSFGLFVKEAPTAPLHQQDYPQKLVITTMERTPQGDILFASGDSLFLIQNGGIQTLNNQLPELSGNEIRTLHLSPQGYLVVATMARLFVSRISQDYKVSDTRCFDQENGFTLLEPLKATMTETVDGTVWLAGVEEMTAFKPSQLLRYRQEDTYIMPPLRWYEHWWVWLMALTGVGTLIWLAARRYEKRRHDLALRRLQREKKLKDLQISAARLKTIPHFHSNVMAAIEYFVMNGSAGEATRYLKLHSDFTNETLINIDQPARTVREEVEYIRKYLTLEQLRYGDRLRFNISIDDSVDQSAMLPTMALHTLCQNAIKHGISPKPEGGTVGISITAHEGDTIVSVEDDGIGREAASHRNTHSTKMGLRILNEQIELMNKNNSRPIKVSITDLKDATGQARGTRFEFTVPSHYIFI